MQPPPPRSARSPDRPRQSSGISFKPFALKARHDGWTPARQLRFIEVLAATRSVTRACAAVGKSRESAYGLRDRSIADPAQRGFARAWHDALKPEFVAEQQKAARKYVRFPVALPRHKPTITEGESHKVEEVEGPPI